MTNNEKLKALIKEYKLPHKWLAKRLGVSPYTIRSWLSPKGSKNYRGMRDSFIFLLLSRINDSYYRKRYSKHISNIRSKEEDAKQ